MFRKHRALLLVACVALGAGAGACKKGDGPAPAGDSGSSTVVARVGGRPITQAYYEQRIAKMERRFLPDTLDLAGRRKFLDFIVNKELMALKADELQIGNDPRVTGNMKIYEDNLATTAAIDQLTKGKLDVTDADIEKFYENKKRKAMAKHIVLRTQREAEELRKKATAANFDSLVTIYSTVPRKDVNTGEELPLLQRAMFPGKIQYGDAIPPVEDAVFGTPTGEVSQPVETGYGWHLFLPISEEKIVLSPLDSEQRERISKQIQMRRKRTITEAYYQDIAKSHGLKIDEEAVAAAYDKFPPDGDPQNPPDAKTEVKPVIPFTTEERARTLLEVDGRKVTIGEFSDKYDTTNWFERPKRVTGMVGVKYWIRDRWFKDFQLERARKDGVYSLPQVTDEVKLRREQIMVSILHENLVGSQAPEGTTEQAKAFYDSHLKFYIDHEKRAVNLIFNQQERVVQRAAAEIKGGQPFVDVAVRYNDNATKPADVQTLAFTRDNPDFQELVPKTFELQKVGDFTEPFKTKDFWVMIQLATIEPERQFGFDEIATTVGQDWKNQWQEDKLNELLADWKKTVKIDIDEKALAAAKVERDDVYVPGRPVKTAP